MWSHLSRHGGRVLLALALLVAVAPLSPAEAASDTITCASCGKEVKKKQAIKVIKDGRVYYVCSQSCADKIKK
jgi:hypothetical protein